MLCSCESNSQNHPTNNSVNNESNITDSIITNEEHASEIISENNTTFAKSEISSFISEFIKNNPDSFNNEVAIENYSLELKNLLDEKIKTDKSFILDFEALYDDILSSDAKDMVTGEPMYLVGFKTDVIEEEYFSDDDVLLYSIKYAIVGGVSKEEMMKLKKNEKYKISGIITSRADEDYSGNKYGFTNDYYGNRIWLGCFFVKDLHFSLFEEN